MEWTITQDPFDVTRTLQAAGVEVEPVGCARTSRAVAASEARGAVLLYFTNLAAIIFSASIVFIISPALPLGEVGRSWRKIGLSMFLVLVIVVGVAVPLTLHTISTIENRNFNEQVKAGLITDEEARHSKFKHIITRSVGFERDVAVDVMSLPVLMGDCYLLCSDGLPDMVEDEDIHLTISTFNASLDAVGQQLVELANDHGGRDNVSVMLAQVIEPFAAKRPLLTRIKSLFR